MVNFYSQSLKEKEYGIGIDDEISLFIYVDRIEYTWNVRTQVVRHLGT